jgi:hypothetical protein
VFEYLPSYSPELNPVEQCWQHMKNVRMVNFVPLSVEHLVERTLAEAQVMNNDPKLLAAFFHHAKLALGGKCNRQGYISCKSFSRYSGFGVSMGLSFYSAAWYNAETVRIIVPVFPSTDGDFYDPTKFTNKPAAISRSRYFGCRLSTRSAVSHPRT